MYERELNLAIKAVNLAGDYLRSSTLVSVDSQSGRDIKLVSDKESERILINALSDTEIPILSEEIGFVGEAGKKCWILDPIDGSMNYFKGLPELSCVSIALLENGRPVLGVINRFNCNELYYGIVGQGAFKNGKSIYPSSIKKISEAVIATGFPVARNYSTESLSRFITLVQNFKKVRMLGSAALMGLFVAAGIIDVYIEEEIMIWDVAASMAIVKAAGGEVDYKPLADNKCICALFATQELKEDLARCR